MHSTARGHWAPGPSHPRILEGAVHVWRADLQAVSDDLLGLLSPEEHERAAVIVRDCDRERGSRARGVLRALLGRYLQADPRRLDFATGEHGKPALRGDAASPGSAPQLRFNLSHSGELALYAISLGREVGIDVELARRPRDVLAVAARALGPAESRRLRGLDPASREQEFLRSWVRHEAELKCLGTGLAGHAAGPSPSKPWGTELDVGLGAAAAVAVEGQPRRLSRWEW